MSDSPVLPSRAVQNAQTHDLFKAGRSEEYAELKEHFRHLKSQRLEKQSASTSPQSARQVVDKKPDKRQRRDTAFKFAGTLLKSEKYMSKLRGTIELASVPAPKIAAPNPFSLNAFRQLVDYDINDVYIPDASVEEFTDSQLAFSPLINRAVIVYDVANAPQQTAGLIEF